LAILEESGYKSRVAKPPGLLKIIGVVGTCAAITVGLGFISIWLGILALPIMYSVSDSLLSD
jgi:hypothetical protein